MKRIATAVGIAVLSVGLAASAIAADPPFSFEGFYLGMSREEASTLQPGSQWEDEELPFGLQVSLKEFSAVYLEKTATAQVQLDGSGQQVASIAFKFRARSASDCSREAEATLSRLRGLYGQPTKVLSEAPTRWIVWRAKAGLRVTWLESCSSSTPGYRVSHTQNDG